MVILPKSTQWNFLWFPTKAKPLKIFQLDEQVLNMNIKCTYFLCKWTYTEITFHRKVQHRAQKRGIFDREPTVGVGEGSATGPLVWLLAIELLVTCLLLALLTAAASDSSCWGSTTAFTCHSSTIQSTFACACWSAKPVCTTVHTVADYQFDNIQRP
jgi:hypothetical protein